MGRGIATHMAVGDRCSSAWAVLCQGTAAAGPAGPLGVSDVLAGESMVPPLWDSRAPDSSSSSPLSSGSALLLPGFWRDEAVATG